MALVESPEVRTKWTSGWAEEREFDVAPALERATSVMWKANLARSALITEAQQWARLDYRAIDGTESEFAGEFTVAVQRDAKCDGIAVWFETSLLDEIGYSTEPGEKQMIYGQAVLPWRDAIALHAGDQVAVSVSANRVERDWFWRWQMKAARAGATLYDLHQSMLGSHEFTPERLRKMASNYRPSLSCEGEVEYMILGLMKDGLALKDIAERIRERFPQTFHDTQSALDRVADISCRYSR